MKTKFLNSKILNSNKRRLDTEKTFRHGKIRKFSRNKKVVTKLKLERKLIKLGKIQTKD